MRYPVRKVYITQEWGVNHQIYSRFGFNGHNGIDLRIYNNDGIKAETGDLISPHDGKIIEKAFDKDGYGNYYKIENDNEGSILAHNSELFLNVGDSVEEGQVIGRTGNTGWSTAPHLHWGYYRFPRDRQNGYGGTINQIPLLEGKEDMITQEQYDSCMNDRKKFWEERDQALKEVELLKEEINKLSVELNECQNKKIEVKKDIDFAGLKWTLNGLNLDKDGNPLPNYKVVEE